MQYDQTIITPKGLATSETVWHPMEALCLKTLI